MKIRTPLIPKQKIVRVLFPAELAQIKAVVTGFFDLQDNARTRLLVNLHRYLLRILIVLFLLREFPFTVALNFQIILINIVDKRRRSGDKGNRFHISRIFKFHFDELRHADLADPKAGFLNHPVI